MSKLKDNEILALQKEVEAKKERIIKLKSKFSPETTCIFNGINLHTQKVEGLLTILARLILEASAWEDACKMAKVVVEFKFQDKTFEQWKHDILFLIDKHNLKEMEEELSEDIEFLDSLVSTDTKNKQKIDKIREKLSK